MLACICNEMFMHSVLQLRSSWPKVLSSFGIPQWYNYCVVEVVHCSACALLMCCLCTPHPALPQYTPCIAGSPHYLNKSPHNKAAGLTGLLGGMSLVEIHLLQRRGQQPGISMLVGSIPNTTHYHIKILRNRCFARRASQDENWNKRACFPLQIACLATVPSWWLYNVSMLCL